MRYIDIRDRGNSLATRSRTKKVVMKNPVLTRRNGEGLHIETEYANSP